jgi:hypothetical protein
VWQRTGLESRMKALFLQLLHKFAVSHQNGSGEVVGPAPMSRGSEWHRVAGQPSLTLSSRRQQKGAFAGRRWHRVGELPM